MKETLELRINQSYAGLLFKADEGRNLGTVKVINLSKDDPRLGQIPFIEVQVQKKYNSAFFFGWKIKRSYTKSEINAAKLFHLKIKTTFEPTGEEYGTIYDETVACGICGANRKQVGNLKLKIDSIPRKDISRTIAAEIVASEKFAIAVQKSGLKGVLFEPIAFDTGESDYYQLVASAEIKLSNNTIAGINPFNFSESSEGVEFTMRGGYDVKIDKEIYKCPKGHTIGLNLISEPYVLKTPLIDVYDLFISEQKVGVKRGFLRPEPIYFCSPAFRKMIEEKKLSGFEFEIANVLR